MKNVQKHKTKYPSLSGDWGCQIECRCHYFDQKLKNSHSVHAWWECGQKLPDLLPNDYFNLKWKYCHFTTCIITQCWKKTGLECGPMTNVMVALPNIGGALCSTPKSLADLNGMWTRVEQTPTTRMPCSNAGKTRNPLKFAGVPRTRQQISAISGPKFTIL